MIYFLSQIVRYFLILGYAWHTSLNTITTVLQEGVNRSFMAVVEEMITDLTRRLTVRAHARSDWCLPPSSSGHM